MRGIGRCSVWCCSLFFLLNWKLYLMIYSTKNVPASFILWICASSTSSASYYSTSHKITSRGSNGNMQCSIPGFCVFWELDPGHICRWMLLLTWFFWVSDTGNIESQATRVLRSCAMEASHISRVMRMHRRGYGHPHIQYI